MIFVLFVFARYLVVYFFGDIWALSNPAFQEKKIKLKKHPSLTGRQGITEHVCRKSGFISKKWRELLVFCADYMCNLRSCLELLLVAL